MKTLEQRNFQVVTKILPRVTSKFVIQEQFYKDIPQNKREQFTKYANQIWSIPLLHNQRISTATQFFWKETIRRSYIASISNSCQKYVYKYGDNKRQKFTVFYPKQKPLELLPVVIYIHGGYFVNGSEEVFEYLGRRYVQKGYIFVSMGFRQLPTYRWPDPHNDIHLGYKEVLKVIHKYYGDSNNIIYLSWSGGSLLTIVNFFRFTQQYQNNVKLFVSLGGPWQISPTEQKVAKVFVDDQSLIPLMLPSGYMGKKLSIPINMIVGTKDKQFGMIYDQNKKYVKIFQENGINATWNQIENHNHYDLVLDADTGLTKIRQFQIQNIKPTNELQSLLVNQYQSLKNKVDQILKNSIWNFNLTDSISKQRQDSFLRFKQIQNVLQSSDLENYHKLFSLIQFFSVSDQNSIVKIISHLSALQAINLIGTDIHKNIISDVSNGKIVLTFALTEAGQSFNLSDCGTKASYDPKTKQFILHNENHFSKKFLCANLGIHANYAVVFAKLIIKNKEQGTHAFIIKIRDKDQKPLNGVIIQDIGHKIALNGVDNGTLMFKNFRVKKQALLNKFANIDQQGNYKSEIPQVTQRYQNIIDKLLGRKIFAASSMVGILKQVCIIGVTFSRYRLATGETGISQVPIGNFQLQRNDLVPVISKSISLLFFHQYCKKMFIKKTQNQQMSILASLDKILMTQHAIQSALVVRQRCGGIGVLSVNNLGQYLCSAMIASTSQGDNKILISNISKKYLNLVKSNKLSLPNINVNKISLQSFHDTQILLKLLHKRQVSLFKDLVTKIQVLTSQAKQTFEIALKYCWQQTKSLSYAYGDRLILESSLLYLKQFKDSLNIHELSLHFKIFGISCILKNLSFYAYNQLIPEQVGKQLVEFQNQLIRNAVQKIQLLVNKLGVPKQALTAPISRPDYFKYIESELQQIRIYPASL